MTNREHGLNLFKIAAEKLELLLKIDKILFDKRKSLSNKIVIDKRNIANLDWQFAQDEFTDFMLYLKTGNLKLDEEK